jgi:hypothetical protein
MKRGSWFLLPSEHARSGRRSALLGFLVVGLLLVLAGPVSAQFSVTITVDENGNGRLTNTAGFNGALASGLFADAGPGGAPNALTYDLLNPPGLTVGDLLLMELGGGLSDVIRFNPTSPVGTMGTGSLVFYSSAADGADTLADQAGGTGLPGAFYANNLTMTEVGAEQPGR